MVKQKSLKINFIMNVVLTMSSFLFPLISYPYVSRILGPEGMGKVSFATSLISYFSMLAQLGIPTYGIRACAKVRDDRIALTRTAQELLGINLIMNVASYAILALALLFVPRLQDERILYIIVSSTILLTSIGMEWLYKALEQYTYITIRSIIFKLIALIAMFFLINEKDDYVIYGAVSIFAASASNILNFFNAYKYIDLRPVGNYDFKRHLKPVAIFFSMSCATTIYTHLDTVMLGFMTSDAEVGYYNAAVKIKSILVSIVTSLGTVLLPRLSYYIEQGMKDEFKRIIKKTFDFVFILASPLMLYFILYAKQGIYFLSGSEYSNSIMPMKIIMLTLLFIGITNILGIQILVPIGKEHIVLYSGIVGAIVDIILNAILIPRYASSGASAATVVTEFSVLIVQYIPLRKDVKEALHSIAYWKIGLGMIIAFLSSYWIVFLELGNFWTLVITAFLFFGTYISVLILTKESLFIELIQQFFRKFSALEKKK